MSHATDLTADHVIAGATPRLGYTLKDAGGSTITSALTTQTATIWDKATGDVVGVWTDRDINGANGNLVTSGVGVWTLPTSATAMVGTGESEVHRIAMHFTYDSDKVGRHWIDFRVYSQPVGS